MLLRLFHFQKKNVLLLLFLSLFLLSAFTNPHTTSFDVILPLLQMMMTKMTLLPHFSRIFEEREKCKKETLVKLVRRIRMMAAVGMQVPM